MWEGCGRNLTKASLALSSSWVEDNMWGFVSIGTRSLLGPRRISRVCTIIIWSWWHKFHCCSQIHIAVRKVEMVIMSKASKREFADPTTFFHNTASISRHLTFINVWIFKEQKVIHKWQYFSSIQTVILEMASLQRELLFLISHTLQQYTNKIMNLKAQARKKHGIFWPWSKKEILAITGLFRILTKLKEISLTLTLKSESGQILNLSFKYYLWSFSLALIFKSFLQILCMVIFTGFDIYIRQVLCFQRFSCSQSSVLGPNERWDCLGHLPMPGYSAITRKGSPLKFLKKELFVFIFFSLK